ncbi:MAG: hypothetical protein ACP59X_12625 [Solidesulfovibrio sp. DCME]|uniref:hypothetical protein n=1 Tax=Solidesulfovibrio sp. DCME TaxID=3447380 RepID=UPI003D0A7BF7
MKAKNTSKLARRRVRAVRPGLGRASRPTPRHDDNLSARIENCLHTILELEPDLERLQFGHYLLRDFNILKMFLSHVEDIDVKEQDVARIEAATENFLKELKEPLAQQDYKRSKKYVVQ